jgi:hypothetical protein
MGSFTQTPFPSPSSTSITLQSDDPVNSSLVSIENAGTAFHALRRSASYHAEVAIAVATIFDNITLGIESDDTFLHQTAQQDTYAAVQFTSHQLTTHLHPLFERVFLIRDKPKTINGNNSNLQCGAFIHNSQDNSLWKMHGVHISAEKKIAIYRACNDLVLSPIFIAIPIGWSTEGLQYATAR